MPSFQVIILLCTIIFVITSGLLPTELVIIEPSFPFLLLCLKDRW